MSRRRGEFEHRTSIFEGAYRAWSHLGGLDAHDVLTKESSVLCPLQFTIPDDPRLCEDIAASSPSSGEPRFWPYEALPRSGIAHPFVQAVLSPWLGPDADHDSIEMGLTTLRTWWQHRRKGESTSSLQALGTERMIAVVRCYVRHFFAFAHRLIVKEHMQAPKTLQGKLEAIGHKKIRVESIDDGCGSSSEPECSKAVPIRVGKTNNEECGPSSSELPSTDQISSLRPKKADSAACEAERPNDNSHLPMTATRLPPKKAIVEGKDPSSEHPKIHNASKRLPLKKATGVGKGPSSEHPNISEHAPRLSPTNNAPRSPQNSLRGCAPSAEEPRISEVASSILQKTTKVGGCGPSSEKSQTPPSATCTSPGNAKDGDLDPSFQNPECPKDAPCLRQENGTGGDRNPSSEPECPCYRPLKKRKLKSKGNTSSE